MIYGHPFATAQFDATRAEQRYHLALVPKWAREQVEPKLDPNATPVNDLTDPWRLEAALRTEAATFLDESLKRALEQRTLLDSHDVQLFFRGRESKSLIQIEEGLAVRATNTGEDDSVLRDWQTNSDKNWLRLGTFVTLAVWADELAYLNDSSPSA